MQESGKWIIFIGILITIAGVIWYFFGEKLSFLGQLPGDIRIEKENFRFYFPITTMILISVLINILLRIFRFLF
jgi:hypothetical protein